MRTACLSLWQPWGSMILAGLKVHETRSWAPPRALIGQRIAIHASARAVQSIPELEALLLAKLPRHPDLPRGALLGTVRLVRAFQITPAIERHTAATVRARSGSFMVDPGPLNYSDALGGLWTAGRWAWELSEPQPFRRPVPARGRQRIWYEELRTVSAA